MTTTRKLIFRSLEKNSPRLADASNAGRAYILGEHKTAKAAQARINRIARIYQRRGLVAGTFAIDQFVNGVWVEVVA